LIQTVPSSSPSVTNITNETSTSIFLTWKPVSFYLQGRNLSGYSIFFKERTKHYLPDQMKSVPSNQQQTIVEGFKKYTDYSLRILAFTVNGNGISSSPLDFKTDEDGKNQVLTLNKALVVHISLGH
jgi:hypothetical protein